MWEGTLNPPLHWNIILTIPHDLRIQEEFRGERMHLTIYNFPKKAYVTK